MRYLIRTLALLLAGIFVCVGATSADPVPTFRDAGSDAARALVRDFYAGGGTWRRCDDASCDATNIDWGADSATDALALRWRTRHEPRVAAILTELGRNAPRYGAPCDAASCPAWSDTPAWDAVAEMREYEATRNPLDLRRARAALAYVEDSAALHRGLCSAIPYQHPPQDGVFTKTLETTANAIKADLLVYRATGERAYLRDAKVQYAVARQFFLDASLPLYTVHVIDDGSRCTQVHQRFFASVNGDMIWNGTELARLTGDDTYLEQAVKSARAVDRDLSDARGVFSDVQGENDVVEPLIEAMQLLATQDGQRFARTWILRNAAAALSSRSADGSFSRFFDGPPQDRTSIWEANGGFAIEIAAAALASHENAQLPGRGWDAASDASIAVTSLPATIEVKGAGVALIGTMSNAYEYAHVHVLIDGVPTTDRTGLWQNPSMPSGPSVLFAWRWVEPGRHTITLEPASPDTSTDAVALHEVLAR